MAENTEPAQDQTEIPANPVLDLQAAESDEEVQAHCGVCVSVVSVVNV
jgi:hypothetical protein